MEKYFENGDLTDQEIMRGLRSVIWAGKFIPCWLVQALIKQASHPC